MKKNILVLKVDENFYNPKIETGNFIRIKIYPTLPSKKYIQLLILLILVYQFFIKKFIYPFSYSLNGCATATTTMQNNMIQKQVSTKQHCLYYSNNYALLQKQMRKIQSPQNLAEIQCCKLHLTVNESWTTGETRQK